ncbi:hypothetical protein pb186bvf_014433 [Paramecium bursaria]
MTFYAIKEITQAIYLIMVNRISGIYQDQTSVSSVYFDHQRIVFIRIDSNIASSQGQGFIASIMDGALILVEIKQKTMNTFTISKQGSDTDLVGLTSTTWYQVQISEANIYVGDWVNRQSYSHYLTFTSNYRFNLFTQSQTKYWTGYACCIIMYKGITSNGRWINTRMMLLNTKYPETIINIIVQEKIQSNITNDYSAYQNIIRLGNTFDFDQSDPYLMDYSLLFNGSQYLIVYDVYLNYQYTIEFRIKLTTLTQDIWLFNFKALNYYVSIKLLPNLIVQFDLNTQQPYNNKMNYTFVLLLFIIWMILNLFYTFLLIQFSNAGILSTFRQLSQSPTQFYNGYGTLTIGSLSNQFAQGEYFELLHFRFYQGYFLDQSSIIDTQCQIYLNDRCIICKPGYLLSKSNLCLSQCPLLYNNYYSVNHNQCLRACHTTCITCSSPTVCLTCSGNRINPPNCFCPSGYFEDFVSPSCRKYIQDYQTQTGQQLLQCSSTGILDKLINFNYLYRIIPKVGIFLVGASQDISTNIINMQVGTVTISNFIISVQCDTQNQFYQVQWLSSVGDCFSGALEGDQSEMNSQSVNISFPNQQMLSYPQILGWKQQIAGTSFQVSIQNQLTTSFQVSSQNPLNFIKYNVVYTNFLTIQYSYATQNIISLDNIPKSIKMVSIFQGLQTNNNTGTFKQMMSQRTVNSIKIYSRLPVVNMNGQILFIAQQCQTGTCNFYEQYISCNQKFELCCNELNYYINSNNACRKCDSSCEKCIGASTYCTQCYAYQNKYLLNGQCLCGSNQYQDSNSICRDCHPLCLTCNSSSKNDCQSCGNLRTLDINMQSHECICQSGYFEDDSQTCQQCQVSCNECANSQSCSQCPFTRNLDQITSQCQCDEGYYQISNQQICNQCPQNCKICVNQKNCLSCSNNSEFVNYNCLCKNGFYLNENNCISCNTQVGLISMSCQIKICGDGSKTFFEQCDDGNILDGDGCDHQCKLEYGYSIYNGILIEISQPYPILLEIQGTSLYDSLRVFQLSFSQELQLFDFDLTQFIIINVPYKIIGVDYTYILLDQSQISNFGFININITIQIQLLTTFSNQRLQLYFDNPQLKSKEGLEFKIQQIEQLISDFEFVDLQTKTLTYNFISSTNYMLFFILGQLLLSFLAGGLDIFFNLLDLLQIISYLQYINTQFPYNLEKYLNYFSFLQIKILDDYINIRQYLVDHNELHISPTKIKNDGITPNLIANLSSYILIWIICFGTFLIVHIILRLQKKMSFDIKSEDNTKKIQTKMILEITKHHILLKCLLFCKEFIYSGLFRVYLSTAYDLCFYLSLNLYYLTFSDYVINVLGSYLTLLCLLIYCTLFYLAINVVQLKSYNLIMNNQKYGSIYQGLKLKNMFSKYYNLYLLLKRLLFMLCLVMAYEVPLFQITGLIIIQIIQVAFLLLKPLKEQFEYIKQILCEILMLIIEIQIFILVLDDYLNIALRTVLGWICIVLITLLISSQIIFDTIQQVFLQILCRQNQNDKQIVKIFSKNEISNLQLYIYFNIHKSNFISSIEYLELSSQYLKMILFIFTQQSICLAYYMLIELRNDHFNFNFLRVKQKILQSVKMHIQIDIFIMKSLESFILVKVQQ